MNFIKTFIYISLFFLIGEMMLRVDKKHDILNRNQERLIEISFKESSLKDKIDRNKYELKSTQKRIMILGDSYIYGGGIKNKDNTFSNYLYRSLKKEFFNLDIEILNLSRPSNNTYNNFHLLKKYYEKFKPEVIIWGYNINDIVNVNNSYNQENLTAKKFNVNNKKYRNNYKKIIMKLYKFSELLRYLSSQIQKQLLIIFGYVIPIGDFYYFTNNGYSDNDKNWKASMQIMNEIDVFLNYNTKILFYNLPAFNLLNHNHLFRKTNYTIENFVNSLNNYYYYDGNRHFNELGDKQFYLSKYDGHPNSLAHKHIAKLIFNNF